MPRNEEWARDQVRIARRLIRVAELRLLRDGNRDSYIEQMAEASRIAAEARKVCNIDKF